MQNKIIGLLTVLAVSVSLSAVPAVAFGFNPFGHRIGHDFNNDGIVNEDDMIMLLNMLGIQHNEGDDLDFNNDGVVNNNDINILLTTLDNVHVTNTVDTGNVNINPVFGSFGSLEMLNNLHFYNSPFYSNLLDFGNDVHDVSVDFTNGIRVSETIVRL